MDDEEKKIAIVKPVGYCLLCGDVILIKNDIIRMLCTCCTVIIKNEMNG